MPRDLDWYIRNFERQKEQKDLEARRAEAKERLRQRIIEETGKDPRARGRTYVSGGSIIAQLQEATQKIQEAQTAIRAAQDMLTDAVQLVNASREETESSTMEEAARAIVLGNDNCNDEVLPSLATATERIEEAIANIQR